MTLLIVIPCLNEEAHIERVVQPLLCSKLPMRIVIADGGSTDATVEIARRVAAAHDNVFYLHNPKRVQSAAVNLAVTAYGKDAEFFIRLDAHADYPDDYCQKLLDEAQHTEATSVVVTMESRGMTPFQKAIAAAQNSKLGNGGSSHRLPVSKGQWVNHGHHALMRTDAFNAVGGYDDYFSPNEDAELDIRLIKAGYKIWLTANTSLIYYPRTTPLALLRQYYCYGRARSRTLTRHNMRPKLRQLLPLLVAPAALLILLSPVSGWLALPLAIWALICVIYGIFIGNIVSGFAAMIMHLGWSLGFWRSILDNAYE